MRRLCMLFKTCLLTFWTVIDKTVNHLLLVTHTVHSQRTVTQRINVTSQYNLIVHFAASNCWTTEIDYLNNDNIREDQLSNTELGNTSFKRLWCLLPVNISLFLDSGRTINLTYITAYCQAANPYLQLGKSAPDELRIQIREKTRYGNYSMPLIVAS